MSRSIYDDELHVHFVTFSCRRRRTILDHDRPKKIVLGVLNDELKSHDAVCSGFVLMPNHMHVLLWFPRPNQLSKFLQEWKQRSSRLISDFLEEHEFEYANKFGDDTSIWERKFYDFNVTSDQKYRGETRLYAPEPGESWTCRPSD